MASKQPQSKKRAQGGGRTPNSEPRQQVFKEFGGCNFQLSPRDFTLGKEVHEEQSDLMLNYVVVQNNASIADNKTIETRNNIVKLFDAPEGKEFTKASILINGNLFMGLDDGSLVYGELGSNTWTNVLFTGMVYAYHHWTSFAYVDDQIVGLTEENKIWFGNLNDGEPRYNMSVSSIVKVNPPQAFTSQNFRARGSLRIDTRATEPTDAYPFRISVKACYVNKCGPTECGPEFTFYASAPLDEWHSGQYVSISGSTGTEIGVEAIEFFYNVGNSQSYQFAGRFDFPTRNGGSWVFDWLGYLDETSMWPIANLVAPTENYTEGPDAKHITCIDGRVYFWGGDEKPERLWIGGNAGNIFSVSPGTGGGYVDVEPGTGQEIRVVTKYKTQSGNSIVTMLCDSKNSSREQRYNLVENSITISNEQSMKAWQAEQVAGAVGCKSFRGGIVCEDGLYSVSRYGLALTTMTMEYNSQIRANYVSGPVRPAFTNPLGTALKDAILLECDGVIYLAFGAPDQTIDNLLFCYDIDLKAWWTITLDVDEPIIDMLHIDYEGHREGIGIVTAHHVYMLPLTQDDQLDDDPTFETVIQTGELSTAQPQQNWIYLSQLEFRFDYFVGDLNIYLVGIDQFGRKIMTRKRIMRSDPEFDMAEFMRVDLRLQSYQIRIEGTARFRLTHFIAKLYTMPSRLGLVWGFDDSQSYRYKGDIHPTFEDYNDIKRAIVT